MTQLYVAPLEARQAAAQAVLQSVTADAKEALRKLADATHQCRLLEWEGRPIVHLVIPDCRFYRIHEHARDLQLCGISTVDQLLGLTRSELVDFVGERVAGEVVEVLSSQQLYLRGELVVTCDLLEEAS